MGEISRVLDAEPIESLEAYIEGGGGRAIEAAVKLGPAATIEEIEASGLRGRGGAGFPTARKWRVAVEFEADERVPATVVVNAAEGEPGSFKDRAILRRNPYRVIEGALVAAVTVGADRIVVALKASAGAEIARVREAAAAIEAAGWCEGVAVGVVEGPGEYLFGEETALLEVLEGRLPRPRVTPPYRRGVDSDGGDENSAADVELEGPPVLVNNVETLAQVALVMAEGPEWFRSVGTAESPGTVVCTVSGATLHTAVAEFEMGTPLEEVIAYVGGEPRHGAFVAALVGISGPVLRAEHFATPVSYEGMAAAGAALGTAGFILADEATDLLALTHAASRFLAVESCAQCEACKGDGLAVADLLRTALDGEVALHEVIGTIRDRLATITDGARCALAQQHADVVGGLLPLVPTARAASEGGDEVEGAAFVWPLLDIDDGTAVVDVSVTERSPDWATTDPTS